MKRRQLLAGLVATAGVMGCKPSAGAAPTILPEPPPLDEWQRFRAEFNLSPDWVHLGGVLLASHPRVVRDAIEKHRRALDDNPVLYLEDNEDTKGVREAAAAYMGARPDEIALTDSTTMGLALLYGGLPLRGGDEVLTTVHDHYVTHESLRLATERAGATVRKVPLYAEPASATPAAMASAVARAIRPETKVVALTWLHSSTGVKTPVRAVADEVARVNAGRADKDRILYCVDGVHGFGVEDASMADLGCDFFAAGCHKWIFGPRGTGILWGKSDLWHLLRPTIPHFGRASFEAWMKGTPPPPTTADMMTPGGFHSSSTDGRSARPSVCTVRSARPRWPRASTSSIASARTGLRRCAT
jgi:selenocysteine lyase/cysteine desulfurase